ncbi:unnamed protein product [Lasius platythorax]|uniref:Uncharacterized protein n=1 Tax=Lasius platythorax TaxID=488582 RepID=A0AAV2NQK8_9HYME
MESTVTQNVATRLVSSRRHYRIVCFLDLYVNRWFARNVDELKKKITAKLSQFLRNDECDDDNLCGKID